jgi:dienelactone hydrolase
MKPTGSLGQVLHYAGAEMNWESSMFKIRRLLVVIAVAMSIAMPGTGGAAREPVDVSFATNVVIGTAADKPVRLNAQLFMPTADTPVSAVVIMPSSGGVKADIQLYYARRLAEAGIAALVIDSFGSRGLKNSIYDQSVLNPWQEENDAFGALRWLGSDDRFRRDRIGIAGVSKGGIVALHTALTMRREWSWIGEPRFAAHVPIVPECSWVPSSFQTTGSPILFLLAELDDQTPPGPCITYSEKLLSAGNRNVEVQLY